VREAAAGQTVGYLTPVFLGSTAFVYLNFSLPIYVREQQVDAVVIGGMFTTFTVTMLICRPLVGWALDRFGRRPFFAGAFVFYTLAMSTFAAADDVPGFYLARFLQGIGASLMWVSARTIVADGVAGTQGAGMGRLLATSVRGSMVGAFYGFSLLAMLPLPQAWTLAFAGYAVAAAVAFAMALTRFRPPAPVGGTGFGPVSLTPAIRRLLVIVALSAFASALIEPVYLIYLKDKFALSTLTLAAAFFPAGVVFAVLPRYAGGWSDRLGRGPLIVSGMAAAGLVSAALPWLPGIVAVALAYVLFAAAWATANPVQDALLADLAPAGERGRLFGWKEAASGLGASLGPLAGGALYDHWHQAAAFVGNGLLLGVSAVLAALWFGLRPGAATPTVSPSPAPTRRD